MDPSPKNTGRQPTPAKGNRRQDQAILALLEHPTMERAAAALNVSAVTLWRWMQEAEFQAAYREARRNTFRQAVARLQHASSAAVSTLLKVMVDPHSPASTRVRTADSVLAHSAKAIEIEDIETRVAELERADTHICVLYSEFTIGLLTHVMIEGLPKLSSQETTSTKRR